jgi:ComF family protein
LEKQTQGAVVSSGYQYISQQLLIRLLHDIKESLLHLAFPHLCEGCGSDVVGANDLLCIRCLSSLPETNFHLHADNPVEKLFWGRLPLAGATAQFYFTKESMMQHLMHQLKYKGNKEAGLFLGKLMGHALAASERFSSVDALIPLPLHPARERRRGYNQATVLCNGMTEVWKKPVWKEVITRKSHTESQTKKGRVERWQNIEGRFELVKPKQIEGKHLLLVDDVITTGATLESCGRELLCAGNVQLSIATLCFSSH